jgi:CheY-like chemotaxis protein
MADSFKLDFLGKFATILQSAINKKKNFPDELCNFLAYEFKFHAAALFLINDENRLKLFAKSSYVNQSLISPDQEVTKELADQIELGNFQLSISDKKFLRISDDEMIESIHLIDCMDTNFILVTAVAHTEESDDNRITKISDLVRIALINWFSEKSKISDSSAVSSSFSSLVKDTTLQLYAPLKNVVDKAKVLSGEYLSTYQLKFVAEINTGANYSLKTVEELSEIASFESNQSSIQMQNINIRELIKEIADNFNFENAAKPETVKISFNESVPENITIDTVRLKSTIYKLLKLSNSLSIEKSLTLQISSQDENINFSFIADGKGFKSFQDSILFEPFDKKNQEIYKESHVTPLGIQILLNDIKLFNGEAKINRSGSGKVNMLLSLNLESDSEIAATEKPETVEDDGRNKVLVIEDDYATAEMLSNYLIKWGYQPVIVNSSEETIKAVTKQSFVVIILDIELPEINGLELLKNIHTNPKNKFTPVIVCSVKPENQQAMMVGTVDFFEKPINYGFLVEALEHYKLTKNSKILCVDDDVPTLSLISKSIESAGYICIAESNSSKVMDLIRNKDIDLAIVDLDMPDPNGYELIKMIKMEDRFKNLPIIIFTGKDDFKEELKNVHGLFENLLEKKSTKIDQLVEHINVVIKRLENPPPVEEVVNMDDDDAIKILLAEDYKHSQIIVTRLLKKNNFENIVVVENGLEAYNLAQKEKFDIILMDMQMPIMNGFEATAKIRELPEYKQTPIIALTAFAMKGDKEKCLNAGATDYIPKPIDSKEFIKKIQQYTD